MKMVKTEKDMQELQLELNMTHDFGRITGDGSGEIAKGPGYTVCPPAILSALIDRRGRAWS
jgi:hypothetical protein